MDKEGSARSEADTEKIKEENTSVEEAIKKVRVRVTILHTKIIAKFVVSILL